MFSVPWFEMPPPPEVVLTLFAFWIVTPFRSTKLEDGTVKTALLHEPVEQPVAPPWLPSRIGSNTPAAGSMVSGELRSDPPPDTLKLPTYQVDGSLSSPETARATVSPAPTMERAWVSVHWSAAVVVWGHTSGVVAPPSG